MSWRETNTLFAVVCGVQSPTRTPQRYFLYCSRRRCQYKSKRIALLVLAYYEALLATVARLFIAFVCRLGACGHGPFGYRHVLPIFRTFFRLVACWAFLHRTCFLCIGHVAINAPSRVFDRVAHFLF